MKLILYRNRQGQFVIAAENDSGQPLITIEMHNDFGFLPCHRQFDIVTRMFGSLISQKEETLFTTSQLILN